MGAVQLRRSRWNARKVPAATAPRWVGFRRSPREKPRSGAARLAPERASAQALRHAPGIDGGARPNSVMALTDARGQPQRARRHWYGACFVRGGDIMMPIHVGARKALGVATIAAAVALLGLQLVPYGRDHVAPPVLMEPSWDQPSTRELAVRACFDCHSNTTHWPWYSNVAPVSWFVQRHVEEGREALNFSEWQRPQKEASESAEAVLEGEMPLGSYALLHSTARLSPPERQALARGLAASIGPMAWSADDD
jgi:hypothetical protein